MVKTSPWIVEPVVTVGNVTTLLLVEKVCHEITCHIFISVNPADGQFFLVHVVKNLLLVSVSLVAQENGDCISDVWEH